MSTFSFETDPSKYRHWKLSIEGEQARLVMRVDEEGGLVPGYVLKLNSYDLGVDIELADAVQRLRFSHPEVRVVVVTSGHERAFCAGANIPMLASSAHAWKVNFCKYTNETRLSIEDASAQSGQRYLAAINGPCAGGGYELALACDEIALVDDGNSAVSLPEVPLLGVLPGTGGLTRVVDKRKVRRDRADVFCTLAEGIKGKRAVQWGLVDAVAPKSQFEKVVATRAAALARVAPPAPKRGAGIALTALEPAVAEGSIRYRHVEVSIDAARRVAEIVVKGPEGAQPASGDEIQAAGDAQWSLRAFRELDDAMLRLRFFWPQVGLVLLKTRGDIAAVRAVDEALVASKDHWLAREILALQARVLRRVETSAKSFFAVVEPGSCFGGVLLELALLADRVYMLNDPSRPVHLALSSINGGLLPMAHGQTRLRVRFLAAPQQADALLARRELLDTEAADEAGLVTMAPDDLDWDDELRVAIEERASMSPDALTGMEASLRFAGPENCDSKIFGRLSAWQNWIFQRPNAVGETGALSMYGKPTRPLFDYRRC